MTLRDMMARHAAGPLVRSDHHGESVTIVQGETSTDISVVVDRLDEEPAEGSPRVQRLVALVFIPASALPSTLEPGHQMTLAMRLGEAATTNRITRIVSQDEGGVLVEVAS